MQAAYNDRELLFEDIKNLIDCYLAQEINDEILLETIDNLYGDNKYLIMNCDNEYLFIFTHVLGKKRMKIFQYAVEKNALKHLQYV